MYPVTKTEPGEDSVVIVGGGESVVICGSDAAWVALAINSGAIVAVVGVSSAIDFPAGGAPVSAEGVENWGSALLGLCEAPNWLSSEIPRAMATRAEPLLRCIF